MSKEEFNAEAYGCGRLDKAFEALAAWWACQLPPKYSDVTTREMANVDSPLLMLATLEKAAARRVMRVTEEQRGIFAATLVEELHKLSPQSAKSGVYFSIGTDYNPDEALSAALDAIGVKNGSFYLPSKTRTYVHDDGNVFVPADDGKMLRLSYAEQPELPPHRSVAEIDFTNCFYFRAESRYLVINLAPGQKFTVTMQMNGQPTFRDKEAEADQVLVLPQYAAPDFDSMKAADLLNIKDHPSVIFTYVADAKDFQDGARRGESTVEELDSSGHVRALGPPFRAKEMIEAFTTSCGSDYIRVNPGDYATETISSSGYRRLEIVPQRYLEEGARLWLACTAEGKLTSSAAEIGRDTKVGKPLQLKMS